MFSYEKALKTADNNTSNLGGSSKANLELGDGDVMKKKTRSR